ncbi:hypothetical protein BDQ12DRAFT_739997 [Crucibulum laeve]|uniref:Aminoglycoside phosphotransferase domain-containing protein n=1 Tax=Crucibulum laeve TaxID=68775 RepID=A0A5C3LHT1_9AGAR|nr:hypothetical protein BDQ12DRAFT_739997 [Crucibulum laeve]
MVDSAPSSSSPISTSSNDDPRLGLTVNAINWDTLSTIACQLYQVSSAKWGEQVSGGYNVVRFLHLDDTTNTVLAARVPYQPVDGMTDERADALCGRICSEVATMEYISMHSRIPIPRVVRHSIDRDGGGVGSPYILMTKVDGVPLCSVWDDMDDSKREVVLQQVIDILLQLSSLRFNSIGALMKGDGVTKPTWHIVPMSIVKDPYGSAVLSTTSHRTYTSALDYWVAYANAKLQRIIDDHFGDDNWGDYTMFWFMRSLIPSLYDSSLDASGFPITPGDFHSQNIMITDTDSPSPCISAVIDWEFTVTLPTSSFAQYPLFIVDHPFWEADHPLKTRNMQDQATFNRLMLASESRLHPGEETSLSRAFATCRGLYLFEQCMQDSMMFCALYEDLFQHIFCEYDSKESFSGSYTYALTNGILKNQTAQFEKEADVRKEAIIVLGEDLVPYEISRSEFRALVLENADKFAEGGEVHSWLATYGKL